MTEARFKLDNPPIVEAVLDIECDLPPNFKPKNIESAARKKWARSYPKFRTQYLQEHRFEMTQPDGMPEVSIKTGIVQALQFLKNDEKQLVQIRAQGFSFNRLAPYTSLDDYLPQIKSAWNAYIELAKPIQIRVLRLRYINRFSLPFVNQRIELDDYLKNAPRPVDEQRMLLSAFVNQYSAIDLSTGHQLVSVLTTQPPVNDELPLIFDNTVVVQEDIETGNWSYIRDKIQEMRELKNLVFRSTLKEKCLNHFQH
jgi:uncharacterized protein (TIGR04255 family)